MRMLVDRPQPGRDLDHRDIDTVRFTITITGAAEVDLNHISGKFASKDDAIDMVEDQISDLLDDLLDFDVDGLGADGDSQYEIDIESDLTLVIT